MTRYFPMSAINFAVKEQLAKKFVPTDENASRSHYLGGSILAGGLSGQISLFCVYPMDYARTQLSSDTLAAKGGKRKFTGVVDCMKQTFRAGGFRASYKGVFPAMIGVFAFRGLWFGFYDFAKKYVLWEESEVGHTVHVLQKFLVANVVTMTAGQMMYPLDTASRRMMVEATKKKQ